MTTFFVEFEENDNKFVLEFITYETPIGIKWAEELKAQLFRTEELNENDRLYNFGNNWPIERIVSKLNDCIQSINEWREFIPYKLGIPVNQEILNKLHKYFEDMRGGTLSPAEFWKEAPENIKRCITDYNVLIHRLEDINNEPRIVITFKNRLRHLLSDIDYDYFSTNRNFGEVYVNYCEVGKPLWDVFKDNDDVVGDDNIRPLKYYSADMSISFGTSSMNSRMHLFDQWWHRNENFLNSLGFHRGDKKLAIGHLPVAKMVKDPALSDQYYIDEITKYNTISKVSIHPE